jgi:hypothetical protein
LLGMTVSIYQIAQDLPLGERVCPSSANHPSHETIDLTP